MVATRTTSARAAAERAAVEPFAAQLLEVARRADPGATYALAPPIDAGIWVMHLYVRGDLADQADLRDMMAERTTDLLIEHDLGLSTVFHDRGAARPARPDAIS